MMNSTNSMGNAVELYFVQTLDGGDLKGACRSKGIAVASDGDSVTIAHEVLHSCILEDIYTVDGQGIPGPVSQGRLPSDWGGGYYPPDLTQRELVDRLIMMSGGYNEPVQAPSLDLPSGSIWGYRDVVSNSVPVRVLGNAAVGQDACKQLPGSN